MELTASKDLLFQAVFALLSKNENKPIIFSFIPLLFDIIIKIKNAFIFYYFEDKIYRDETISCRFHQCLNFGDYLYIPFDEIENENGIK